MGRMSTTTMNEPGTARPLTDWGGNILALLVTLIANTLANALPLGGQTTGEISDKYPSLFTPAGYVFSIWGLIYLTLLVFICWQALPAQRVSQKLANLRVPFQISCVCNAAWIFAWHFDQLLLSLVIMLALLWSLLSIYRLLHLNQYSPPGMERWCLQLPFSLYVAWISVALIANASAIQIHYGWDEVFVSATTWTLIKLAVAGAIAVSVLYTFRDRVWMLVIVWASLGISFKHADVGVVYGASMLLALLGIALVAIQSVPRVWPFSKSL
jgi:hypothetical protein